jgi:hypothetical protein
MASEQFEGVERRRFPGLLAFGLALAAVVLVVAFVVDAEFGWALLVLTVICAAAAVAFRLLTGANRDDADSSDNVIRQPATTDRPLGDTPEAHDEINPHDLPLDNPARRQAERQAGGMEGTTTGPLP